MNFQLLQKTRSTTISRGKNPPPSGFFSTQAAERARLLQWLWMSLRTATTSLTLKGLNSWQIKCLWKKHKRLKLISTVWGSALIPALIWARAAVAVAAAQAGPAEVKFFLVV